MQHGRYETAYDGLRAISVMAVIFFHYVPGVETAGYLGVDIFFVISGFVITASILNSQHGITLGSFAAGFYMKRIRRLFPALLLMVIIMSVATLVFTSYGRVNLRTGALSLIGGSNIFLYIQAQDYFALGADLNVFTHTWSLATEDQFYFLYPFLIWYACKLVNGSFQETSRLIRLIGAFSAISLFAYFALNLIDPVFAFYMLPTRLWQIGAGALCFLSIGQLKQHLNLGKYTYAGSLIIILVTLAFGGYFSVLAPVIVTASTALLLVSLWQNENLGTFLRGKLITYIGRLSYSLYLWHWPILVLAKHTVGTNALNISACVILSFGLAAGSYHLVERPLRFNKRFLSFGDSETSFRITSSISVALTLLLALALPKYAGGENNWFATAMGVPPLIERKSNRCEGIKQVSAMQNSLSECLARAKPDENNHPAIYLIGDSHAGHLVPIVQPIAEANDWQFRFYNSEKNDEGVRGLIRVTQHSPRDIEYLLSQIAENDLVLLSFHRGRVNRYRDAHVSLNEDVQPNWKSKNLKANLLNLAGRLHQAKAKLILIHDTPLLSASITVQACALQSLLTGDNSCKVSKAQDLHTRWRQDEVLKAVASSWNNVILWDPAEIIYETSTQFDIWDEKQNYLMHDQSHISEFMAERLRRPFSEFLARTNDLAINW